MVSSGIAQVKRENWLVLCLQQHVASQNQHVTYCNLKYFMYVRKNVSVDQYFKAVISFALGCT